MVYLTTNTAALIIQCLMIRILMNNELRKCGRKQLWTNLTYYPGICLEALRKTTKNLSQDSRSLV
jgi:hypothetical protein